jgi:glycosyltransferase involved in cell wall biosynthesis
MNILFVSAVLPYPLHSGGQIRIYNLLKRLSVRHKITLVSFIRSEQELKYQKNLDFCHGIHMVMRGRAWQMDYVAKAVFGAYPFLLATYDNSLMRETLRRLANSSSFDVMHLEPFYVWPSVPDVSIPIVVSEHNIEYDVYNAYVQRFPIPILKPFLAWDVAKLKNWERLAWRKADQVTAVSDTDAATISDYLSHPITVVPNGVDIRAFPLRKMVKHTHPTILFVGNFRWHPNRDAARFLIGDIWPALKRRLPSARLRIVGRDVPSALRAKVLRLGGVVREEVSDIATAYRSADMLVAPHAIAGGTKFKMLEAMATGIPIVTSPKGAEGLAMEPNKHYLEAQTAQEFVAQILTLWDNRSLAQAIARQGRSLVEARYNWDDIARLLDGVWRNAYDQRQKSN